MYITQSQFDTEYNSIKEIFAALGKLRITLNGLRPSVSWGSGDKEAKREALIARLYEFKERYNAVVGGVESAYIFVPEEIYKHVSQCVATAHTEIMLIETSGDDTFSSGWFHQGSQQRDKFHDAYQKAANLARERFKSLSVISQPF